MANTERAGHPEISMLYTNHHRWLLGWLSKKIGNAFDAADLAQDTFMRILAARDPANIHEPRAYLTMVAKGVVINWYQRKALERTYLEALALLPEPQVPSAEQRLLILETLHEIDAMLDALQPKVKTAFLLSQIEGLRYEEIAKQMAISLITVKRYMKQAFLQCLVFQE